MPGVLDHLPSVLLPRAQSQHILPLVRANEEFAYCADVSRLDYTGITALIVASVCSATYFTLYCHPYFDVSSAASMITHSSPAI